MKRGDICNLVATGRNLTGAARHKVKVGRNLTGATRPVRLLHYVSNSRPDRGCATIIIRNSNLTGAARPVRLPENLTEGYEKSPEYGSGLYKNC